jgi:hypothetical protein
MVSYLIFVRSERRIEENGRERKNSHHTNGNKYVTNARARYL